MESTEERSTAVASAGANNVKAFSKGSRFAGPVSRFCDYFVVCGLDHNSGLEALQSYEVDGTSKQAIKIMVPTSIQNVVISCGHQIYDLA